MDISRKNTPIPVQYGRRSILNPIFPLTPMRTYRILIGALLLASCTANAPGPTGEIPSSPSGTSSISSFSSFSSTPPVDAAARSSEPLIGGQKDEHGCLIAAGYRWCEPKQKCLRMWEEECYATAEDAIRAEISLKHELVMDNVHLTVSEKTESHIKGDVRFEEEGPGGLILATKINGIWRVVYEGNGSIDCTDLAQYEFPETMMVGVCD